MILAGVSALLAGAVAGQSLPEIPQVLDEEHQHASDQRNSSRSSAPEQISEARDSKPTSAQLTIEAASRQPPNQLTHGARSAQAPTSISAPSDGRTAKVDRVEGADRCDPAVTKGKQLPACKRVIETRAGEYARPEPVELTPEQHLLIDQQASGESGNLTDTTRRLAANGEPDSSPESLAIASIVLGKTQPKQEEKQHDPTTDAAVQAVIQLITQRPQN